MDFKNKKILVTGGLGFIGSNLAIALVKQGARLTILDNMLKRQGGNLFNVESIKNDVEIIQSDIRDELSVNNIVKDKELIFHLAGQVSHVDSIRNPLQDLSINVEGTLVILEACRKYNKDAKILFSGTRGQYGNSVRLPVDEGHPMNPRGVYAITNLCAENLVTVYDQIHKIRSIALRITNTYGPRHQMAHDEYGVLNWFIRKAIDNEEIPVFGDGKILRDFLFIDDLVDAMIRIASEEKAYSNVFNVGSGKPTNFIELARLIVKVAGSGRVGFTEFTPERKEIEPGDYYADITKINKCIGWSPKVSLEDGIARTIEYYKRNKEYYWR
ncbi:MAG: NAD-dependent epimerase/dehydratase family protein [Candidatus Omnitrophota bacterium]|nr:MAG: NAD-dependent epimerase/dehydratase family protein [Candidatus Omnitrophota bacterium]